MHVTKKKATDHFPYLQQHLSDLLLQFLLLITQLWDHGGSIRFTEHISISRWPKS